MTRVDAPPLGHYWAHEVGQLAGVSGKKIGQWARRAYIRSSQSVTAPLVYSYQDIAEAMVVHLLEERGIAPDAIGIAVGRLREEKGTEWPLQQTELKVGRQTENLRRPSRTIVEGDRDLVKDHPILVEADLISIANELHRGGWAARELPELQFIEVNPERLSGRPTIRGRRIAVVDVANIAAAEDGMETLKNGYDLSEDEIRDAVRWWEKVQAYEAAA